MSDVFDFLPLLSQELCRELLSRDLIYLIDDVFWNLSFKNETQAEKVIVNMHIIPIIHIYTLYLLNLLLELDRSYLTQGIAAIAWGIDSTVTGTKTKASKDTLLYYLKLLYLLYFLSVLYY